MSEFENGSAALELMESPESEDEKAEAEKQRGINLFYDKKRVVTMNPKTRLKVHEALANFAKQLSYVYDGEDGRPNIDKYKFYHILVHSSMPEKNEELGLTDIDIDSDSYPKATPDDQRYSSMKDFIDGMIDDKEQYGITPELVTSATEEREAREEASLVRCKDVKREIALDPDTIKEKGDAIAEFEQELEREGYTKDELFKYRMYHILVSSTPPDYVANGPFFDLPGQRIETFINSLDDTRK